MMNMDLVEVSNKDFTVGGSTCSNNYVAKMDNNNMKAVWS